ncbi:MAG: hypothetical protein A3J10_01335 [Candidatus Sungbacteria bacterium RIFCSPLOWO2_02_FULL_54_10]|nr:MAG: hypothetical protein A3J10_01335 [Candidatus Sungbacteria bacterium RIFCSPLOWO2_02_FULL_54_10]
MDDYIVSTRSVKWQSYVVALGITALIFGTAFYAANYFNELRAADIRVAEENISIDILSLETQFALLASHSCRDISENSVLSKDIGELGERIGYLETRSPVDQEALARLKRYYSLLQIKDLLLMQEVSEKCGLKPIFILYFYSNRGDCEECQEQGYVLTALSREYPNLRVYSFDYNLEVSALQTLIQIHDVANSLPALVIKDDVSYGLQSIEDIEVLLPELATLKKESRSATSTD